MSENLVKMCRRLSRYAHAQLSATDLERIANRIEELEADLRKMALDYLAAEGQAAEAYQAQLEAEAKLANIAHAVWTEHKDWEGERKYALRQIVKWLVRAGQD
jgi:outer membrane murein-binding lipoprotein Lpp